MRQLHNRITVPPGGYHYTFPDGQSMQALSMQDLLSRVRTYAKDTNQSCPTPEEVEDHICQSLDGEWCHEDGKPLQPSTRALTLTDVINFTRLMLQWLFKAKAQLVDQSVAEARARTCSTCFLNRPISGCSGCAFRPIRAAIKGVKGGRTTTLDPSLHVCVACGCSLDVKVWFPQDVLKNNMTTETKDQLPEYCWLND